MVAIERRFRVGGAAATRPEVPPTDGAGVPDVAVTDLSGVYTPIAPMVVGGAVGAVGACGSGVVDAVTLTGNDGARLAVVPARLPCRGRS